MTMIKPKTWLFGYAIKILKFMGIFFLPGKITFGKIKKKPKKKFFKIFKIIKLRNIKNYQKKKIIY
jgi:hypothetical protein